MSHYNRRKRAQANRQMRDSRGRFTTWDKELGKVVVGVAAVIVALVVMTGAAS